MNLHHPHAPTTISIASVAAGIYSAIVTALLGLALTAPETIGWILTSDILTTTDRLHLLLALPYGFFTQFTTAGLFALGLTALLVGVNTTLLITVIKRNRAIATQSSAVGVGGLLASLFGVGCASCGTIVVLAILGQFGSIGLLSVLPFGGAEFSFLGCVLLAYTAHRLWRTLTKPPVCAVSP